MDVLNRLQRELPDTDKDRYDVAYERGRAQARSSLLFGGIAIGALVGAALTFLFDPDRGEGRRAQIASRADELRHDLASKASHGAEDLQHRAKDMAAHTPVGKSEEPSGRPDVLSPALDPSRPGASVSDPINASEAATYGSSGPVAGATATLAEEPHVQDASEGRGAG